MKFLKLFFGGGYTKDTIRGVSWIGALRGITRIVSFLRTAILSRILTPSQFGAFGIASLALAFLEIVTETGVNVILVQEKDNIDDYLHAAWIISIVRGVVVSLLILFSAPFIVNFFHAKDSLFLLQLISIVPFIRGFINPSVVKLQKELAFRKEFWYRFSVFTFDAGIAVFLGMLTKEVSSIVYGLIAGVLLEVFLSFIIVSPVPRFRWENVYLKKIIHRGKWVTLYSTFNYLFSNGDNIIVGRLLGMQALGLYQIGYSLAILPLSEVAEVVSRVTFPVYTKISTDRKRLRLAFLKITSIVSFLSVPFGILLFFFPSEIVKIVFGHSWLGVVPIIRVLAIFGIIRAITGSISVLFLSVGKQEYVTAVTFASIIGLAVSIIPLVMQFGIVGAAYSATIGSVVALPLFIFFTIKILKSDKD